MCRMTTSVLAPPFLDFWLREVFHKKFSIIILLRYGWFIIFLFLHLFNLNLIGNLFAMVHQIKMRILESWSRCCFQIELYFYQFLVQLNSLNTTRNDQSHILIPLSYWNFSKMKIAIWSGFKPIKISWFMSAN